MSEGAVSAKKVGGGRGPSWNAAVRASQSQLATLGIGVARGKRAQGCAWTAGFVRNRRVAVRSGGSRRGFER